MNEIKTAQIKDSTYENIYFDCPCCGTENIINRATELKSRMPVSGKQFNCQNCKKPVWVTSDTTAQASYMLFLTRLDVLKQQKLYRDYILTLCQGIEMFFVQALVNYKLDRNPLFRNEFGGIDLPLYNYVRQELETAWKAGGFVLLRDAFREEFKSKAHFKLEHVRSDESATSMKEINRTKINELRNAVVHSTAYLPTLADIEAQDDLVNSIIWLGQCLNVTDSVLLLNRNITDASDLSNTKLGRPKLGDLDPRKIELAKKLYRDRRKNNLSVDDICELLGVGRTTLYRYIGETA